MFWISKYFVYDSTKHNIHEIVNQNHKLYILNNIIDSFSNIKEFADDSNCPTHKKIFFEITKFVFVCINSPMNLIKDITSMVTNFTHVH